ncbi:MAG: Ppx/GppA phosphatase family protein [bacterium]|jgi:exopolyphosphatase/guanosine-5'-triphosphate,3'-diphosphate pyrophosphatase|nr:Ppx/GppA phosphatase family protein [bacterium]
MRKIAVLDIGTNSVKFLAGVVEAEKVRIIEDKITISRLGKALLPTGSLSAEAMDGTMNILADFLRRAREHGTDEIVAVGTMCLRQAENARAFVEKAEESLGLKITVIDGLEEARLAFLGARVDLPDMNLKVAVVDTGGGSTELIFGSGREIADRMSLPLGAVSCTERFLSKESVDRKTLDRMLEYMESVLVDSEADSTPDLLIGISGTVTTMGAVFHAMSDYRPEIIRGTVLTAAEVDRQIDLFRVLPLEKRKEIIGLEPKRADIILAGAAIVRSVLRVMGVESLTISDRGLRHGLLIDRFGAIQ